jgi:hypothetical protein
MQNSQEAFGSPGELAVECRREDTMVFSFYNHPTVVAVWAVWPHDCRIRKF